MDQDEIETIALFRYELIQPIVANTVPDESKHAYMTRIAATERKLPNGKLGYVGVGTLRDWATRYRKQGLKGLKPKPRNDQGNSRRLTASDKEMIEAALTASPNRPATRILQDLIAAGQFPNGVPSVSTVQRYIAKSLPAIRTRQTTEDMRAFQMAHVNELWQIDTTNGPWLTINGRRRQVYIVGVIDDASRYLVGWHMSLADNSAAVQLALKQAIQTYGRPRRLYADNGKPYVDRQLSLICAELGIGLQHTQVYHGNQKGKIERWFGVMKAQWMSGLDYAAFHRIADLNESFAAYVRERNNQPNRSLENQMSPVARFSQEPEMIHQVSLPRLADAFLHRIVRKVAKDGTISINGTQYETGSATIGTKVTVKYSPDWADVWLVQGDALIPIQPVNKVRNAHTPRRRQTRLTEDV